MRSIGVVVDHPAIEAFDEAILDGSITAQSGIRSIRLARTASILKHEREDRRARPLLELHYQIDSSPDDDDAGHRFPVRTLIASSTHRSCTALNAL